MPALNRKIVKVRPTGGIVADLPAFEVAPDFYTTGNNVHFRSGFAERTKGHAEVYTGILSELRNILNTQVGSDNFWVYQGINTSHVVVSATHTAITIAAGLTSVTAPNSWTTGLLGGVYFANNGTDTPMYWDGIPANKMLVLPNFPAATTVKAMRAFKYHLIGMHVSDGSGEFPTKVIWSHAAAPGAIPTTWAAAATNQAGDSQLSQTPGPIIDGFQLRSSFILYKQNSAYIMDFVEGNNIFNIRPSNIGHGVLSRNCIAPWNGKHVLVTDGDIRVTDGTNSETIIDNRMRKFLFDQLDQDNYESIFIVPLQKENEIWVCFPSSGNTFCDIALVWDGVANAWGVREIPLIAHANNGIISDTTPSNIINDNTEIIDTQLQKINQQNFSLAENSLVLAKSDDGTPTDSQFLEVDSGTTFDGTLITATIAKYSVTFDEPNRVKFVRRVVPHVVAAAGTIINFRIGSQFDSSDSISWETTQTFTVGTDTDIKTLVNGKLISFEFSTNTNNTWQLVGFDVEADLKGWQ